MVGARAGVAARTSLAQPERSLSECSAPGVRHGRCPVCPRPFHPTTTHCTHPGAMSSSGDEGAPPPRSILVPSRAPSVSLAQAPKKSLLKDVFISPNARAARAQRDAPPLGHSYRRAVPLSSKDRDALEGPSVLARDPRGSGATFGDGVLPAANSAPYEVSPVGSSNSISTVSAQRPQEEESDTQSDKTDAAPSLRFAPLPIGRPRRRQSFSVGLAARSHLLSYQGSAPKLPRQQPPPPQTWGLDPALLQAAQKQAVQRQAAAPHRSGGPAARRDDVVDVGEVVQEGVRRIFRRLRKDRPSSGEEGKIAVPPTEQHTDHETAFRERSHSISIAELKLHPDHIPAGTPPEEVPGFIADEGEDDDERDSTSAHVVDQVEGAGSESHHPSVWRSPYQHPQIPRGEHDYHPPEWEDEEGIPEIAPV